jgi:hypothetical protein
MAEVQEHARFKVCAERHGLGLHRIHVLAAGNTGSFQSTLVLDCACGLRWLLRVAHGDVVAVDRTILDTLRQGREGQVTAPPGFAGAPLHAGPARARRRAGVRRRSEERPGVPGALPRAGGVGSDAGRASS